MMAPIRIESTWEKFCRIHQLNFCKGLDYAKVCLGYDTKQFDAEDPVMLERWGMRSTRLLSSLPGSYLGAK